MTCCKSSLSTWLILLVYAIIGGRCCISMDIVAKKDFKTRGLSVAVTMTQGESAWWRTFSGDDATRYKLEWIVIIVRKQVRNATAIWQVRICRTTSCGAAVKYRVVNGIKVMQGGERKRSAAILDLNVPRLFKRGTLFNLADDGHDPVSLFFFSFLTIWLFSIIFPKASSLYDANKYPWQWMCMVVAWQYVRLSKHHLDLIYKHAYHFSFRMMHLLSFGNR